MPASRNSLDQRAISSPADLNFPQLLLQQGAECSGSSGFSFISDCCPSLSPRREKSGLTALICGLLLLAAVDGCASSQAAAQIQEGGLALLSRNSEIGV